MKAFFDIGREDLRPLLSRIGSRFSVGVGVLFTGYLAFSQDQKNTPCFENTAFRATCRSPIAALDFPGRGLRHELFIHENEEGLENIVRGTTVTTHKTPISACPLLKNSVCGQSSIDGRRCRSPDSRLLTWESSDGNSQSSQFDDEQETPAPSKQNGYENRLLEYFDPQYGKQNVSDPQYGKQTVSELKRKFIKIDMIDEMFLPRKIPYWAEEEQRKAEPREMLDCLEIMFTNLKRSWKLELPAIEYENSVRGDCSENEEENDADDENKMKSSELLKDDDDNSNHSKLSLHIEQDSDIEQRAECATFAETSSSSGEVQEVEDVNELKQIGAQVDKSTERSSDLSNTGDPSSEIIVCQVGGEKLLEHDPKLPSPNKMERAKKVKFLKGLLNTIRGRTSGKVCDSDNDSSFHSSASLSTSATSNNGNSSEAQVNKSIRWTFIKNIMKLLPGKLSHPKKSAPSSRIPSSCDSSERDAAVSRQHSGDSSDSRSCLSLCSEKSVETAANDKLARNMSLDNCWQSDGAWCHNAYRLPIGISAAYRHRKLGDYLNIKNC